MWAARRYWAAWSSDEKPRGRRTVLVHILEGHGIKVELFADDVEMYVKLLHNHDLKKLQAVLDSLVKWAETWQLTISIEKSCVLNKGKGKGLDTCYSATYMSQTRDQQRFPISEVAADWYEPMVPQRIMWPSIARANGQLDQRCS